MDRINCTVSNCSHNGSNICYADRINVGGNGAESSSSTCCASFLDRTNYGNLTNNLSRSAQCDSLVCNVFTCTHNENNLCGLNTITIDGSLVNIYSETSCSNFSPR